MFEHVYEPPRALIEAAVEALHQNLPVAFIVNKDPEVYCVMVSTAAKGQPYEVDFVCTPAFDPESTEPPVMMPMSPVEHARMAAWTKKVWAIICRRWRKKYPQLEN